MKHPLLLIVITITLGIGVYFVNGRERNNDEIRIHFPTIFLNQSASLLDPSNTHTIWEYYLLENLSCGLVRDDIGSATGYSGCIAEKFYQESAESWTFRLRHLQWSDGTFVADREIRSWIESLSKKTSRHLKYLKTLKYFTFDGDKRILRLIFNGPVDERLLHELSIADANLIPENFVKDGWLRTVGPYKVLDWHGHDGPLKLKANPFSPLYSKEMPQFATLFWVSDLRNRFKLFEEIETDVAYSTAISNRSLLIEMRKHSAQEHVSHPTTILFFCFNQENPNTSKEETRRAFAQIIAEFKESFGDQLRIKYDLDLESQLIPKGFNGRLNKVPEKSQADFKFLPRTIKIALPRTFDDLSVFVSGLEKAFSAHGVHLDIVFSNTPPLSKEIFAILYDFVGNQLDPSGSWSFLLSPPNGLMNLWIPEVQDSYDSAFKTPNFKMTTSSFESLHKEILYKSIAVPVALGSIRYLLSDRIDSSRWNKFDSRLRIYELRLKR